MARNVWEIKAPLYDIYVTRTRNKVLKNFLEAEEKLLDEVLVDVSSKNSKICLIEVGSGTGRTLFSCLTKRYISDKLTYLIGLDNAGAMYDRSKSKLESLKSSGIIPASHLEKLIFLHMDATEMSLYFQNGKINLDKLLSEYGPNSYVEKVKARTYDNSCKLVVNLLNTLGVMKKDIRSKVLDNMVFAAGPKGRIVVSVFDAACFGEIAPILYNSIRKITGKFNRKAFDPDKNEFQTKTYYSHWFSQGEIVESLEKAGAKVMRVTPIRTTLKGLFVVGET